MPGESRWVRLCGAALLALLPLSDFRFAWLSSEDASNGFALLALLGARGHRRTDARHLHYWEQVIPGMVLLVHMAARELAPTRQALWAAALLPAFALGNVGWTLAKCVTDRSTVRAAAAAYAIDSQARPGDRLFVGGHYAGTIYFFTRTEPANDNAAVKLIRDWFAARTYARLDLAAAAPWNVYRLESLSAPRETPGSGS